MSKQELFEQIAEQFAILEENNGGTTKASQARARKACLLYTSPSPRDATLSRMPSSA